MQSRRKILAGIGGITGVSIAGYAFFTINTENNESNGEDEQNTTGPVETTAVNTSKTESNTGCVETPLSYSPELLTSGSGGDDSLQLTCEIPVSATIIENGGSFFTFTVPTTSDSTVEITLEFEYTDIPASEYAASDSYSEITSDYNLPVSDARVFVDNENVLAPEIKLLIPTEEGNIRLTRNEITDSNCPTIINNVTTKIIETTEQR